MSLLLEALRRAEADSKKRKLAASASAPAPLTAAAELTLEAQMPAAAAFPEISLVPDEVPVGPSEAQTLAILGGPRPTIQAYGRYARSISPAAATDEALPEPALDLHAAIPVVAAPTVNAPRPAPDSSTDMPAAARHERPLPGAVPSPRQAKSAAAVMAGSGSKRKSANPAQRRQRWLLALALMLALPLVVFLLFGDAILRRSGSALASNTAGQVQPQAQRLTPPVSVLDAQPLDATVQAGDVAALATVSAAPAAPVVVPVPAAAQPKPLPAGTNLAAAPPALAPARPVEAQLPEGPRFEATPRSQPRSSRSPQNGAPARGTVATAPRLAALSPAGRPASLMDSAYAAYQAGQPEEARRLYREVLRADPTQRDAWLGLAVIAHAGNQPEPALDAYKRVLRLEPQNATALAGVSSLRSSAGEPQQESRLRELLARSPHEADLNNALGLVLSAEQRWSEAQPLFFKAHALAPQQAQFAYNLAVTLDHLRKSSLALQYYETALALAQGSNPGFDAASARNRLAALKAGAAQKAGS